jgi:peptidoglycan/LPS O-acetylase OafA/YrhL
MVGMALTLAALVAMVVFGNLFRPDNVALRFYANPIMLEFGAGMLIGLALPRLPKSAPAAVRPCLLGLAVACVLALVLGPLYLEGAWAHLVVAIPAVVLVACAVTLESLGWRLTQRPILALGAASYSMYLSHPFVTQVFQKAAVVLNAQGAVAAALLAMAVACVILVALLVHYFVEKPLTTGARRLVGARRLKRAGDLTAQAPSNG